MTLGSRIKLALILCISIYSFSPMAQDFAADSDEITVSEATEAQPLQFQPAVDQEDVVIDDEVELDSDDSSMDE